MKGLSIDARGPCPVALRIMQGAAFPILAAALLAAIPRPAGAAPVISEILARNSSGIADEDGSRADWIEIFNPDAEPWNLAGCTLTDRPDEPAKWTFPEVSIPAGGYLVVFAGGKNRTIPGAPLHTNFSLSSAGEYLAFRAADGTVLTEFAPKFPPQSADVSWGIVSSQPGAAMGFFNTPSPGAPNLPASSPAEAVAISPASRTFLSGSTLTVTLAAASPTAVIRYTLDRSVPTAASPLYTVPVTISATTRLRARAFEPGRPDGPVRSESYLALDPAAAAFTSNLPILLTHTWNSGALPVTDTAVPGVWMVFAPQPAGGLARLTDPPAWAGPGSFERRGSSTLTAAKYSFALESWDEANTDRAVPLLDMPADADWVVHAPFQFDRCLFRNDLAYHLSRAAGRWAPRTRLVEHFHNVNDALVTGTVAGPDYFGVCSLMEKITRGEDRVDVERLTTLDNAEPDIRGGYILKIDRLDSGDSGLSAAGQTLGWVYPKERSPDASRMVTPAQTAWMRSHLDSMWAALNAPDFWDPDNGYARWLDPAAAADHHLLNTAAKNVDALRLSAYLSKSRDGRIAPGPLWDFDRAMGSADGRDLDPLAWRGSGGDLGTDFFHHPWYQELFRDSNFWQRWIDRLDELRQGPLAADAVLAAIDAFAAQLQPSPLPPGLAASPAARNQQRWAASGFNPRAASSATPGTNGTFAGEVQWLKNWWTSRLAFMDGQFARPPVASIPPGPVTFGAVVSLTSPTLAVPGAKLYATTDGSDPRLFDTTHGTPLTTVEFIGERHPVRAIVPTFAQHAAWGQSWRGADLNGNGDNADDFGEAGWFENAGGSLSGVGYDDNTGAGAVSYLPFIGLRWHTPANPVPPSSANNTMIGTNQSCYLRFTFSATEADLADLAFLTLRVRYDDGFVAFLNGVEIARANEPSTYPASALTWNSSARATNADSAAVRFASFPVSSALPLLHPGRNVLAIHGLNSGLNSSDFLCHATLSAGVFTPDGPEISPAAFELAGPLTVTEPVILTVRTWHPAAPSDPPTQSGGGTGSVPNGSRWSALRRFHWFPGAVAAASSTLHLAEILYHPPPVTPEEAAAGFTDEDFEFIRLVNPGPSPVDLTGIRCAAGIAFQSAAGLQNWLAPGASTVIVRNSTAWIRRYGSAWPILGIFTGQLDNAGERLLLVAPSGEPIADVTYDDAHPWPQEADAGRSLVLMPGAPPHLPSSWLPSLDPGGSGVTAFATWRRRHFPSDPATDDALAAADPDHDGASNLMEFARATDPLAPGTAEHAPALDASGRLVLRRRSGTALAFIPEVAPVPGEWAPLPDAPAVSPHPDGTETAAWPLPPPSASRRFARIRVLPP